VSATLPEAQQKNEHASSRCIGLTIETRPDWFRLTHADQALFLGATRVELGVQTIFDKVLFTINRGHTVTDSIAATRIAKDAGFKVCYHMMPGLPGSTLKMDEESLTTIFQDERFKPDMIKIYPTLTIEGTTLFDSWKKGRYYPFSTQDAVSLLAKIKGTIPKWVRIQRIQRDIPAPLIDAGVRKSNLRQLIEEEMDTHHTRCRCIRCREVGHASLREDMKISSENLSLDSHRYAASGSEEIFLSLVEKTNDVLMGYLRLRDIQTAPWVKPRDSPCMIIRELRVLGREVSLGQTLKEGWQHRGFGKILLKEAERICIADYDKTHLYVLSGMGVKEYYRALGFQDDGVYLCKEL
jgi:elongator complex protein 3